MLEDETLDGDNFTLGIHMARLLKDMGCGMGLFVAGPANTRQW
jgi:hypothetical protein